MKKIYKKAIIDIGTNSCRLFISEVEDENEKVKILKKLYKETSITKLGNYMDKNLVISVEGINKLIEVIKYYKDICTKYFCDKIIAFGTSAIRESKNKDEIINEIFNKTGIKIEVVSGNQEGEMTFLGSSTEFSEKIMLIDIGGGSTEFIFGDSEEIKYLKSFKLGAVRETKDYFSNDNYEKIKICQNSIRDRIKEVEIFKDEKFILVGVAGTVTTNVSVYKKMKIYNSEKVHLYKLTKSMLEENLKKYLGLNLEERMKMIGLQPERGENIVAGTIIVLEIMNILGKDEIIVSECDGLEGAMITLK